MSPVMRRSKRNDVASETPSAPTSPNSKDGASLPGRWARAAPSPSVSPAGFGARRKPSALSDGSATSTAGGTTDPNRQANGSSGKRSRARKTKIPPTGGALRVVPYEAMLPDGVAWLGEDAWSISAELGDISYLLSPEEVQTDILNRWGRWLNGFGGAVALHITIVNEVRDSDAFGRLARMSYAGEAEDDLREDFNTHITRKLSTSRGNVLTRRYITFTLKGEKNREQACERLHRTITDAQASLRQLGCTVRPLGRTERLELLASKTRRGERFTWTPDHPTLEAVAPRRVEVAPSHLMLGEGADAYFHASVWVGRLPAWLSDRLISDLAEIRGDMTISMHLQPYDNADGLDLVRGQIANLEMQYTNEKKRAAKKGLDADQVPHGLTTARDEAKELRRELESSTERLWSTLTTIGVTAPTKAALDSLVEIVTTTLRSHSCGGQRLTWMGVDALRTELPLGYRGLPMERTLTTGVVSAMHPFTTQELIDAGGICYGINARSGNPVIASRAEAINGNGFILGTSGSGKSHASKAEALSVLLTTDDDVIIIDPEREYAAVTEELGGQRIALSADGQTHINAMAIDLDSAAENPILAKAHFVLGLAKALIGGADGLSPGELGLIDRSTVELLRAYALDPENRTPPTLTDLRDALRALEDPEARGLARSLDLYTDGSLGSFSKQTNVRLDNRLVCFDIADLSAELKTIGMMIILDQVWQRVTANRARGRRTWLYVDEFHMLFRSADTGEHFLTMFKRARKWGLMLTGITQNIEELLGYQNARLMLANSDFLMLLNQSATDADAVRDLLRMSEEQRDLFTGVAPGTGLLKSGNAFIPFDNQMERTGRLYRLFSTKFAETA